jgi:hypothetical protein
MVAPILSIFATFPQISCAFDVATALVPPNHRGGILGLGFRQVNQGKELDLFAQ